MSQPPIRHPRRQDRDPVARTLGGAALVAALGALVFGMTGLSQADGGDGAAAQAAAKKAPAKKKARTPTPSKTPKKNGLLLLSAKKKYPASVIPKVAAAKNADKLGGASKSDLQLACPETAVDLGTWCLDSGTYPLPPEDIGKNDFRYATQACVKQGGYLPSAAQLIGAAARVKLAGSLDDSETTAAIDIDRSDGLKDQREMSSTLFTTTAGASAAGAQGVTAGSRGDPRQGEPDPVPSPSDPLPTTVNYMTVYDDHDHGGFGGGAPLTQAEKFRCAYDKIQGVVFDEG